MTKIIRTAVIPSAGLGVRLVPATKQQPKEMLPIFEKDRKGLILLKPVIQVVFERLYDAGLRQFLFVVGRGKRSIEDQFTIDNGFMEHLKRNAKPQLVEEMERFYRKVRGSNIVFINQPEPLGFGEAVLRTKTFSGGVPFIVHAGDDLILSSKTTSSSTGCLQRLMKAFYVHEADGVFFVHRVKDPSKYGVVEGEKIGSDIYQVKHVEEKPKHPKSKIAIVALYAFNEKIYHYLERVHSNEGRELQLTSAIERLIEDGGRVYCLELKKYETRIDVGTPESYWDAVRASMS